MVSPAVEARNLTKIFEKIQKAEKGVSGALRARIRPLKEKTAKREEEISQVLWPTFTFFCGLALPVQILPLWGQTIAYLIPLTSRVDATRRALILGLGFADPVTIQDLLMLLLQTVILMPLGLLIFSAA